MTERTPEERKLMLSRRRFLGVSGMALGGLAVACGTGTSTESTTTTTAAATTTTTAAGATTTTAGGTTTTAGMATPMTSMTGFTVGYNNPNRMLRSPLYAGQSLGFFKEVGIESFEINDADDPVPPTVAGTYQIALFDSDVLFDAIDKGVLDAKMISVNLGGQPLILLSREGFPDAESLKGARVGGGRAGQVNEALCKYMLQQIGLDWQNDVVFTEMTGGSNDWVQALLTGQIDATIAFPRHIPLVTGEGGNVIYNDFLASPQGGFAMTTEAMDADPNFAAAWNYAYIKAQRWVKTQSNFDQLVSILSDDWGIDLPDAFFDEQVRQIDGQVMSQDLGFDPAEMDKWMDFVAPFGNVAQDINSRWRDYVDVSALNTAQEALGLDPNPSADLSSGKELIENF